MPRIELAQQFLKIFAVESSAACPRARRNMLITLLLWIARTILLLELVAAVLPLVPAGAWAVRLCDFPRLQLAMILAIPLVIAIAHGVYSGWKTEPFWLIAITLLIAAWQLAHVVPYTPAWSVQVPTTKAPSSDAMRVVVANVEIVNTRRKEIIEKIESINPDVLLLIEVDDSWRQDLTPLREKFAHHCESYRDEGLGIALWSNISMRDPQVKHLVSERRASIHADLEIPNGELIHFVGVHPTPPGLMDSTEGGRRDSRVRDAELVLVAREVQQRPDEAWIVTGDFNDVAWSHTTRLFQRLSGLKDPRVGRQLLNTYHSEYPLLRYPIDHVFLSRGFSVFRFGTRKNSPAPTTSPSLRTFSLKHRATSSRKLP